MVIVGRPVSRISGSCAPLGGEHAPSILSRRPSATAVNVQRCRYVVSGNSSSLAVSWPVIVCPDAIVRAAPPPPPPPPPPTPPPPPPVGRCDAEQSPSIFGRLSLMTDSVKRPVW